MALELIYYLQKIKYQVFDTFPQRTDPVKEAEYNILRVKQFWRAAKRLDRLGLMEGVLRRHDALGSLEIVEEVLAVERQRSRRKQVVEAPPLPEDHATEQQ
eukprot:CAMPEP_0116014224 /NCGR_PEP_ID=MMETSP0321-20121206/6160_1 /TAXON_ID=163516 /ORGANISM="Leptocylindrus danicus var. danicus, Strain B650" /LENGTH=100 /DNA_ID=CAMNT_0003483855 /DNA_START=90 /DNA_END=393 /DNA_ORIENTATION=+